MSPSHVQCASTGVLCEGAGAITITFTITFSTTFYSEIPVLVNRYCSTVLLRHTSTVCLKSQDVHILHSICYDEGGRERERLQKGECRVRVTEKKGD